MTSNLSANRYSFFSNSGLQNNLPLSEKAKLLYKHQLVSWVMLQKNTSSLNFIETKKLLINGFPFIIQHNPHRLTSSSAKTDKTSISNRPCFLCAENLPLGQEGIIIKDKYILLCNPYPIFAEHFTLPLIDHKPQQIFEYMQDMLDITRDLADDYVLFYNGAKCGASAPDHFHFQICRQGDLPITSFINSGHQELYTQHMLPDYSTASVFLTGVNNFILLKSKKEYEILSDWNKIFNCLMLKNPVNDEPMLNIISFYKSGEFYLIIFPREKHRPDYYFMENDFSLVISPASIDLCGVTISPRHEDFIKLNSELIEDIYRQVTFSNQKILALFDIKSS